MAKKYDTIVYIGRFQPFHNAHVEIIRRAATMTKKLLVIVGSANQPRTFKNPFTEDERTGMIVGATVGLDVDLYIRHNIDTIYNDQAWAIRVQSFVNMFEGYENEKVAIIGHKKDESTFYLDMFPQWDFIDQDLIEPLNATNVRDLYFRENCNMNFIKSVVPEPVFNFLLAFRRSEAYNQIIKERQFVEQYKKQFAHLPYEPTFVTVDNVVIQSGHVLMIRRRAEPGKGLWALPGGFLNAATDHSVMHGAIRELKEETGIKVPVPVLVGSIKESKVFDAIDRSARGRTITHAFKIVLPDGPLPKVKGLDDADKAKWIPIANVDSRQCFEDHYEIIQHFIGA